MRKKQNYAGYLEINTPDVMDRSLWKNLDIGKNLVITCLLLLQKKKKPMQ